MADTGGRSSRSSDERFAPLVIPAGTDARKIDITVTSGNGELTMLLGSTVIANVESSSNGGLTNVDVPGTRGATVSLVSENDDIAVKLPRDFASDEVILQADDDEIDLGPFSDIKNGAGADGRGTAGSGLALLKLVAKEFAGSSGKITLR